ncbi:peptidylprolyl isomerase, FKBP-type [Novosphingobium nitrogenifigens DSM 19370]|uniref:Peptidyl-prolyl cis-trans isomerase n=1 Tax=Novosphingobium nitrogenifigens DSM 19370 TaxID=983920 RepID=F1ZBL9_9SPHN|nr:FKBP-type peptidyl-prolyl cis-trans isomerase [Novosphingobium nitrogenifigens]EGD57896.1 peptidylprolyl isomerase, FKBP-type [Novosphingobium nitrogenifigens DSM 19370]
MSEITRVPLQPVAKGSLGKLWLGAVVAVALGGATAYATRAKGLEIDTVKAGTGAHPAQTDYVLFNYVGHLANGKEFDRGDHMASPVTGIIPGLSTALQTMQKGGKYHVYIPSRLAYGSEEKHNQMTGEVSIPANSDLVFDIELVDFKNGAEIERQRAMMRQMEMQMRGAGAGAPAAGPDGAAPAEMPHP